MLVSIYCDGGARGNPGPAAAAFVVFNGGKKIYERGKYLGTATNNVAEYTAVILALKWLVNSPEINTPSANVNIFLDSQLVVKQLTGEFKIKNTKLKMLSQKAKQFKLKNAKEPKYHYIPRKKNELADALVNKTLDGKRQ